jgi:glutathione reductase (NADPH)
MLCRLGVTVSMFYRDRLPLRGFDEMLRTAAATELQAAGIDLHPGSAPRQVQRAGSGFLLSLGSDRVLDFPWVLNATGRRPNTAALGLASVGIQTDAVGAVPVDARQSTRADGVHAIGDVTDRKNLTPVAIAQGRALADTLFGATPRTVDLARVASAVFMLPPIASVGYTEAEALAAGLGLQIFETDFRPMKQAFIGGHERTRIKLLVDAADSRVVGLHMIGADAPEIVQSLAVALSAGATKADFDRTVALHPTSAEEFVLLREPTRTVGAPAAPR